jgi:hypothetical protein
MKKHFQAPKLVLNTETLRQLDRDELNRVAGAARPATYAYACTYAGGGICGEPTALCP